MSRATSEVKQEADLLRADCKAQLALLPEDGDIPAANERERVFLLRRRLSGAITAMTSPLEGRVLKLDLRLASAKHWHTTLTACRIDLEKGLLAVESGKADFRLVDALRLSLRILRNGSESESDEMFATPLMSWLHKNGVRPAPGERSYLGGRGGLLATEAEITELETERDEIIARVEAAVDEAKNLLASLPAIVATTTV